MAAKAPEQLSKISPSTVTGGITEAVLEKLMKARTLIAYDVIGVVKGAKVIPPKGDFKEAVRFIGQFKATNRLNGNHDIGATFTANRAYFPAFIEEELYAALQQGATGMEVALRIGLKFDVKAATKYVYTAESLIPMQESDALKALELKVAERLRALPAPKKGD